MWLKSYMTVLGRSEFCFEYIIGLLEAFLYVSSADFLLGTDIPRLPLL